MDRIKTTTHDIQTEQQKLITIKMTLKYNEEELQKKQSELQCKYYLKTIDNSIHCAYACVVILCFISLICYYLNVILFFF